METEFLLLAVFALLENMMTSYHSIARAATKHAKTVHALSDACSAKAIELILLHFLANAPASMARCWEFQIYPQPGTARPAQTLWLQLPSSQITQA